MRLASPLLAVLAGFVVAGLMGSCNGKQVKSTQSVQEAKRQEITALWTQVREWRKEARMPRLEPSSARKIAMRYKTSRQAAGVCADDPQPKTEKCKDVCSLADNICQNAGRICRIADELKGDEWARDKCTSAKASCRQAKERCCKCVGRLGG